MMSDGYGWAPAPVLFVGPCGNPACDRPESDPLYVVRRQQPGERANTDYTWTRCADCGRITALEKYAHGKARLAELAATGGPGEVADD